MIENTDTHVHHQPKWQATTKAMHNIWDKIHALADNPHMHPLLQDMAEQTLWDMVKATYDEMYDAMQQENTAKNALDFHIDNIGEYEMDNERLRLRRECVMANKHYFEATFVHTQAKAVFEHLTGKAWAITLTQPPTDDKQ